MFGRNGPHYLDDGRIEGDDPLAPFGPHAVADLRRHDGLPHVGDIVINSRIDDVHRRGRGVRGTDRLPRRPRRLADRPVLVHPRDVGRSTGTLDGADAVHRQLVQWLEQIGQRADRHTSIKGESWRSEIN